MSIIHNLCDYITLLYTIGFSFGPVGNLKFKQGTGPILMGYLYCSGNEANLTECSQNYRYANTISQCLNHYYDAAVKCECKYCHVLS